MMRTPFVLRVCAMFHDYLKTIPQFVLPKKALTAFAGLCAEIQKPIIKNYLIRQFIHKYAVNMSEAQEENPDHYACFNDFFIRHLKPGARPIATADLISPVDGQVSEIGKIQRGMLLQAKKHDYSVEELLACSPDLSAQFKKGSFATLYLSPKDYHRVHMPIQGTLKQTIYVPGRLFSVQPLTARVIPRLFARNERLVIFFNTKVGLMAMVMVGATIVGSIGTSWNGDVLRSRDIQPIDYSNLNVKPVKLEQGAETGYFKLGSTVILLFAEGARIQWTSNLQAGTPIRLGQEIGRFVE